MFLINICELVLKTVPTLAMFTTWLFFSGMRRDVEDHPTNEPSKFDRNSGNQLQEKRKVKLT